MATNKQHEASGGADKPSSKSHPRFSGVKVRSFARAALLSIGFVILIFIVAAVTFFGAKVPSSDAHLLTTTLSANTESFRFVTPAGRDLAWTLPPGEFSAIGLMDNEACTSQGIETLCNQSENSRLVVRGVAEITVRITPDGGWTLSVSEIPDFPADVTVFDVEGDPLLESEQLLHYYSGQLKAPLPSRLPFVAASAVIGADLHQSSTIDGTLYDLWQPVLLSGDVQMIADNRPGREKYLVLEDRLEAGDVVHVGEWTDSSTEDGNNAVWGMLGIDFRDAAKSFKVVLHTSLREISVTRFGAPEGHVIRASDWAILQKWPNGQYAWVSVVSFVGMLTFVITAAQCFDSCQTEGRPADAPSGNDGPGSPEGTPISPDTMHTNDLNNEGGAKDVNV